MCAFWRKSALTECSPRASCYLEQRFGGSAPGYTVFFKGRKQHIQGGDQRHVGTTWNKRSLQAFVYPSPMWYRIWCWSAPDSLRAGVEDQPRTAGWRNASHITRLPPTTVAYFQVQYRYRISLPLIPITRLPPATTRCTKSTKYTRGLLYFTNYHIHDYEDFKPHNKVLEESKQHTRRIFIDPRSGAHGPGAPAEQT